MNLRAQAGLEYLFTYGWALVLIATVLGVLVFVAMAPVSTLVFSSSDPAKIVVKGSAFQGNEVEVKLQNITGGKIKISTVSLPASYSGADCSLNGTGMPLASPVEVMAGGEIFIQCSNVTENPSGRISIEYTDFTGLQRSVGITASGMAASGDGAACTDGETRDCPLQLGVCSGAQETCTGGTWPGCNAATYQNHNAAYEAIEASCDDTLDLDNDCDGYTDCDDSDCTTNPTCAVGLIGYWQFNEGTGTFTADSSGNGNNGTLLPVGSEPIWQTTGCSNGNCLSFDGVDDYINIGALNLVGDVTVSVWAKSTEFPLSGYKFLVGNWGAASRKNYALEWYDGYDDRGVLWASGDTSGTYIPNTYADGVWHHVVGIRDGSTDRLYIDGLQVASAVNGALSNTGDTWHIGAGTNQFYFNGIIDEVKIYDMALSASEVCSVCKEHIPSGGACNCT